MAEASLKIGKYVYKPGTKFPLTHKREAVAYAGLFGNEYRTKVVRHANFYQVYHAKKNDVGLIPVRGIR